MEANEDYTTEIISRKKEIKEEVQQTPSEQFIAKIAKKQKYNEDLVVNEIYIDRFKTQQYIIEINESISELESGCSATVEGEETPRSESLHHEQNSPIISHATQLKQVRLIAKNQKKAGRFQIDLKKSNILLKRSKATDRLGSDRVQSALSITDQIRQSKFASARFEQNMSMSDRIGSARQFGNKNETVIEEERNLN